MNVTQDKSLIIGWIQGFVAVFIFLGINQVFGRYSTVILEVNPVVFSCAAFSSCAFLLLAISGPGVLARETIRSVDTWVYGFVLMLSYVTGMILYNYITSTELTMLQKVSVGLSLFGSWFFIGRNPDRIQVIGTLIITLGVILVAIGVKSENKGIVFFLSFLYGFAQVARVFTAELHRPHAKAKTLTQDKFAKARVIGFIMLVVSTIFIIFSGLIALAQEHTTTAFIKGFPMVKDFIHPASIFAGMVCGVFLIAPLRILEFSSSSTIKAENFMIILTFMTVATFIWEWATAPLTGLTINSLSGNDLIAAIFITAGGFIIAVTRGKKKKNKFEEYLCYNAQNLEDVDDSREMLANTLEHFEGSLEKSAKALDVHPSALEAMLNDKDKVLAFKPNVLKEVARRYRRKVATSDALTGLANRAGFMTALKGAAHEAEIYSLLYIDLDKFKPVNDTYGHDAGDYVLKGVAERLVHMFPNRALATRLGGDEFCVLLLDADKDTAKTHIASIQAELERPFRFDGKEISISASIGVATYPHDSTNPEELLKQADEGMFSDKGER